MRFLKKNNLLEESRPQYNPFNPVNEMTSELTESDLYTEEYNKPMMRVTPKKTKIIKPQISDEDFINDIMAFNDIEDDFLSEYYEEKLLG